MTAVDAPPRQGRDVPSLHRGEHDDRGVVLVWTALVLVVLMGMAALSVDVATFYLRAEAIQRTADAAALAGVAYMPDLSRATQEARAIAQKNGFVEAGAISVIVDRDPGPYQDARVRVRIRDDDVSTFFGSVWRDKVSISRTAVAEYTSQINMGSPENYIGYGNTDISGVRQYFWLAVNGYCFAKEQGDQLLAGYNFNLKTLGCGGEYSGTPGAAVRNQDYKPSGYTYAVTVPAGAGATKLDMFDPWFCPQDDYPGVNAIDRRHPNQAGGDSSMKVRTGYRLVNTNGSPNPSLHTFVTSGEFSDCPNNYTSLTNAQRWTTLRTLQSGTYWLYVYTLPEGNSYGTNAFSLRGVETSTGTARCTSIVGAAGYRATCPRVMGLSAMSVWVKDAPSTANFYLADIPASYAGRSVVVSLWDPGEGMRSITVLDPSGSRQMVKARTIDETDCSGAVSVGPFLPSSGFVDVVDVSGTRTPGPCEAGSGMYNSRRIEIFFTLPISYAGGWWRINYAPMTGNSVADRTTWQVRLVGDPVHLVRPGS